MRRCPSGSAAGFRIASFKAATALEGLSRRARLGRRGTPSVCRQGEEGSERGEARRGGVGLGYPGRRLEGNAQEIGNFPLVGEMVGCER